VNLYDGNRLGGSIHNRGVQNQLHPAIPAISFYERRATFAIITLLGCIPISGSGTGGAYERHAFSRQR
jgi:hypothetical protein